jgi:hypothetical protein
LAKHAPRTLDAKACRQHFLRQITSTGKQAKTWCITRLALPQLRENPLFLRTVLARNPRQKILCAAHVAFGQVCVRATQGQGLAMQNNPANAAKTSPEKQTPHDRFMRGNPHSFTRFSSVHP